MPNEGPDTEPVTRALRVLREFEDEDASLGPAPDVETRLLAEVRALRREHRRRVRFLLTVAAACVVLVVFGVWQLVRVDHDGRPSTTAATLVLAGTDDPLPGGNDFLPIGTGGPMQMGLVIRVTLAPSALAAFGVTTSSATQADLLVGDDGFAHGIRLVR